MPTLAITHTWPDVTSETQLTIYTNVVNEVNARGIPFAVGGSLAMAVYAGLLRPSKDLDLYVTPDDKDRMIEVMRDVGLDDYYDKVPYDRGWIYRSTTGDVIVDVIWNMANRRAPVDHHWITNGPQIEVGEQTIRVIPVEEMIWSKLYVMQRERCDWPDILNLIHRRAADINWHHLLSRIGDDAPLLGAVLSIYSWLCPENASKLPSWLHARLRPNSRPVDSMHRVSLLDSRPWLVSLNGGAGSQC